MLFNKATFQQEFYSPQILPSIPPPPLPSSSAPPQPSASSRSDSVRKRSSTSSIHFNHQSLVMDYSTVTTIIKNKQSYNKGNNKMNNGSNLKNPKTNFSSPCPTWGLNLGSSDYNSDALTTELPSSMQTY